MAVAVAVAVAVGVGVGVGEPDCAQYRPPVFTPPAPPQTIISLPVQTAGHARAVGALIVLVAVQLLVLGSYLLPVLSPSTPDDHFTPCPYCTLPSSGGWGVSVCSSLSSYP